MKIYFAGSIRGGRLDADLYRRMIEYMQKSHDVLTEHVGSPDLNITEQGKRDVEIALFSAFQSCLKGFGLLFTLEPASLWF